MKNGELLDITPLEYRLKHPVIFEYFDQLDLGDEFILLTDHDAKPLYYHLLNERGNVFSWNYLEQGPQYWKIKIAKRELGSETETVGDIAVMDYRKAEVFRRMGIDFCCGGSRSLKEAATAAGISWNELHTALEEVDHSGAVPSADFNKWEPDSLTDYIVNTHHSYIKENATIINEMAQKVSKVHGNRHPELMAFATKVSGFIHDLLSHSVREEKILFPHIKLLTQKRRRENPSQATPPGLISSAIRMMQVEHEGSGEGLRFFREITDNYALPGDACDSYHTLFKNLEALEEDLLHHIHLENNILFPKALKLEAELGHNG